MLWMTWRAIFARPWGEEAGLPGDTGTEKEKAGTADQDKPPEKLGLRDRTSGVPTSASGLPTEVSRFKLKRVETRFKSV